MKSNSSFAVNLAQNLVLGLLLIGLSGCGGGGIMGGLGGSDPSADDSGQAKAQKDNDRRLAEYRSVAGIYAGTLTTASNVEPLTGQMVLYIDYVQDGVDANNAPKSHPILRGQFKLDRVGEFDDHNFIADFKPMNGEIRMTQGQGGASAPSSPSGTGGGSGSSQAAASTTCPVGPKDALMAVSGRILNGQLLATVTGSYGPIGTVSMTRKSTEAVQPLRDQRERLVRAFNRIVGTYDGVVRDGISPTDAQVVLNIEERSVAEGLTCPSLKAQFKFTNAVGKLNDSKFGVAFRESTSEIHFIGEQSGNPRACPVGPNDPQIMMDGKLDGSRHLIGRMSGTGGTLGDLDMRWSSESTVLNNDQSDRLSRAYANIAGTYGGRFSSAEENFPIKLVVSVVVTPINDFISCPALKAQYIRPDLTPGVGQLALSADFHPSDSTISFKSTTSVGTGVPGHTDLSISARWEGNGFRGSMQWWDKSGTVAARKCPNSNVDSQGSCKH